MANRAVGAEDQFAALFLGIERAGRRVGRLASSNSQRDEQESDKFYFAIQNIIIAVNLGFMAIAVKRVYEPAVRADGKRVLVDRLWPRGLRKSAARIDLWLKELAPSDALRKWFGHRPEYFTAFRKRYLQELGKAEAAKALEELYRVATSARQVTLLYAAKDEQHNNAVVLKELLEGMRKPPTSSGPARAAATRARARMPRR